MQPADPAPEARLRGLYRAFNARQIDVVLAELDPDVSWPNGWEGGAVVGHQAVRDYWQRQWAAIDPQVEPGRIWQDGAGCYLVEVHQLVRDHAGGTLSDSVVQHVFHQPEDRPGFDRMEIREASPDLP